MLFYSHRSHSYFRFCSHFALVVSLHRKLFVKYSDFVNNTQGIFNSTANNSLVQYCRFETKQGHTYTTSINALEDYFNEKSVKNLPQETLDSLSVPIYSHPYCIGIHLNASTGYTIQGNTFTQFEIAEHTVTGIYAVNSGSAPNVIDNNEFKLLHYGILTKGNHRDEGLNGLQIRCNTFSDSCKYAIAVASPNGIAAYQGETAKPAGNIFTQKDEPEEGDILTRAETPIYYHYGNSNADEEPLLITPDYVHLTQVAHSAGCGLPGNDIHAYQQIAREELVGITKSAQLRYANLQYTYHNLIDGGSTGLLLTELELSWDKSAWVIRDKLLAQSPYLSSDIILDIAKKGILPHAMLLEICLSNPDATRMSNFLDELKKHVPMPNYMFEMIIASWSVKTFRTSLEASLSDAALMLEQATRRLIDAYLSDTTAKTNYSDSIADLLEHLPNIEAVYELTDLYAGQGNFQLACNKIDNLLKGKLSKQDENEARAMLEWYGFMEVYTQNSQFGDTLSSKEVKFLTNLAQSDTKAGQRAESMLYCHSGCTYNYHPEPLYPELKKMKSKTGVYNLQEVLNEAYNKVSVFPNPAQSYATFMYELQPDVQNCTLQIFDLKGTVVLSTVLTGNTGHYLWDTRDLSSGSYLYTITADEKRLNSGKVVVKR